eukprot:UC1_evm2s1680
MESVVGWVSGLLGYEATETATATAAVGAEQQQQSDSEGEEVPELVPVIPEEEEGGSNDTAVPNSSTSSSSSSSSASASSPHTSLQTEGMLTKAQLLEIFSRFKEAMATPEAKVRLKASVAAGRPPEDATTAIQREILVSMGIDADHGLACFKRIIATYNKDPDVIFPFREFIELESISCDEAELSPVEFAAKKKAFETQRRQQAMLQAQAQSLLKQVTQEDPATRKLIVDRARAHNPQAAASQSDERILMTAMQKLAIAQKRMEAAGLDPSVVFQKAMASLRDPNFKPPPPVSLAQMMAADGDGDGGRSEEHTSELQSHSDLL